LLAIIYRPDVAFFEAAERFAPHWIFVGEMSVCRAGQRSCDVSDGVCLGTSRVGAMNLRTGLSGTSKYLPRLV
jgi:hypothetical protein